MKGRYKVLPLTFPFNSEKDLWEDCVKKEDKIEPIFNRNGYYFDRQKNFAWLEIDGEAWFYGNRKYFQYSLDVSEGNNVMPDRIFEALNLVLYCGLGLRTKKLDHIWAIERDKRELRKISRDSAKFCLKFRKEYEKTQKV